MAKLFNRAKMTTSTTGTGTITLGSASNGFQSFADAGVANGDVVQYVIEEGSNFEIGTGTYTATGTTLSRSPTESSNSDNAISLAGNATVSITAVAADMNRLQHNGSDKVTVSSTGASVTGNISVTGTVDGRDVATDGSKLDGIESGADVTDTANVTAAGALMDSEVTNLAQVKAFDSSDYATAAQGTKADNALPKAGGTMTGNINHGDNVKAQYGAGNDLQIYHDGTHSYVTDEGTGALYLRGAGYVYIQKPDGTQSGRFDTDGAVDLFHNGSEKFSTTSTGISVTGNATFADNGKAIFGAGSDLQIYHNSSNGRSYITESGSGAFVIQGENLILEETGGNNYIQATAGGAVQVYHNGSEKLATTSTGIDVTGTVVADGLTVDPASAASIKIQSNTTTSPVATLELMRGTNATFGADAYGDYRIRNENAEFFIDSGISGSTYTRLNISAAGDIKFYEDTGVDAKMRWLAAAEKLRFEDNVKATFGASDDLQIYHNGSHSYIQDVGTGRLYITTNGDEIRLTPQSGGENGLRVQQDGAVNLYYDNAEKFATTSTGISVTGNVTVSGTVDGRDVAADGTKLDGIESGATADQTITAGTGLTGGGTGDVTISHADTSTLSGTYGSTSNGTKIDQITVDANGHVTAITTGAVGDIQGVTAGSGLTGGGTSGTVTVSHADTSTQASVNNSGRTYIQDITLDTYGHITGITSATETVTNTNQLTTFQLEDGDGTEVTISHGKEVKFVEGTGIDINWTDTSTGSDGDPYDMTFAVTSAPKWTTSRTLSLSGDASGSVSWDGSANATLSVTVADDSHNHTIANVDGLQTALDGKLSTTGKAADSELLDGVNGASYLRSDADDIVTGHTEWQDNYQIRVGNGADFRIYHNGSHTYLRNYNHSAGNIYIQGENTSGTNQGLIYGRCDAARTYVQLYENSVERLRTVSDGVDIYGSLDASGSVEAGTADGGAVIRNWTGGDTYAMFGTANMTGDEYALITNGTHTWLGSGTGGTTYIRGPVNSSTAEIRVTSAEVILDSSSVVIPDKIVHEGDTNTYMQFHAADQWRVVTGGTERLEVNNSHVEAYTRIKAAGGSSGGYFFSSVDFDTGIYVPSDGNLAFDVNGSERVRIDGYGKIGVGTTSPNEMLSIYGSLPNIELRDSGTGATNAYARVSGDSTGASLVLEADPNNSATGGSSSVIFKVDGSEAGRINNHGDLRIGTTGFTSSGNANVAISSAQYGNYDQRQLLVEDTTSTNGAPAIGFHAPTNSSAGIIKFWGPTSAFECRNSTDTGFRPILASAFTVNSDYRLKENVVPLEGACDRLSSLPVHRFNFIEDIMGHGEGVTVDGFLAHEVADVVPEAVLGIKDEVDSEGNPQYQGVDQSKLVPLLTAALQEAIAKIETLETKVAALEAN